MLIFNMWKIKAFFSYIRYDIPYGIQNLFKWFSIVWKDRDWDYAYIFIVLKFKIHNTALNIVKYGESVDNNQKIKYMLLAEKLIDYISQEHYLQNSLNMLSNKWGHYDFENNNIYEQLFFSRQKIKSDQDKLEYKEDFSKAFILADKQHNKAKRLLFNILNEHIETWWN